MDFENKNSDVYYLINELSKQIYDKQCLSLQRPYIQSKSDMYKIKKLRSKAFEILLNKDAKTNNTHEMKKIKTEDPVIEIYKYAFVLKLHMRHVSRGISLEKLIDEFNTNDLQAGSMVYLVLQLLTELKDLYNDEESDINIFYYSNINPALFECLQTLENVTQFPMYPIETFILSHKLDAILDIRKCHIVQQTTINSIGRSYFYNHNILPSSNKLESIRYKIGIDWLSRPKSTTDLCPRDTISYFLPQTSESINCNINYINEPIEKNKMKWDVFWMDMKFMDEHAENGSDKWKSSKHSLCKESENTETVYDIWGNIDITDTVIFNYYTWEILGEIECTKQPNFLTDIPNAMLHLTKMKQIYTLLLIPKNIMGKMNFPKEITIKEFLMNIKLLLLGIETKSFQYNNGIGFYMCQNMTVYGLSNEALVDICAEFIYLGNCFKYLTKLITPDSQTGKLPQEGLIFKAMCKNITEILLYYRASLLRIFKHIDEYTGLLSILNEVQTVALLLKEVAKLCQYNGENEQMGENCNIFTIINKKITNITLPQIALVFYTILKSCCVVYFRFLQKWLFEGICHDTYGEFMIKEHPQFLREKGPKFWTKSFTIQKDSVPSFLNGLTESILQCGKAVRLLKICDPKNPVCSVFTSSQPELKVCLSVTMLREQFKNCQEYKRRGEEALGRPVSLSVAIQDQKNAERKKADIVIRAQRDTLLRIKREHEEFLKTAIENKRELLKVLKEQAIAATMYKAKEKQTELLTDQLLMEKNNQREKESYDWKYSDRADFVSYYDDLDTIVQKQQIRTEWRNKRMKCYDKRVNTLFKVEEILSKCTHTSDLQILQDVRNNKIAEDEKTAENISNLQHILNNVESNSLPNSNTQEDENSNFDKAAIIEMPYKMIYTDNINVIQSDDKQNTLQDSKNTKEQFTEISNIHNASTLDTPTNMNYIYKCNNEKSSLQEFLRSDADNINVIQSDDKQNTLQDSKNTKEQFTEISNIHNASTLDTPANMNYIYKCNNEKSSLQEFLRSDTDNINVIQSDDKQNTLQDSKNTKEQFTEISDIHNASTLDTPANMNYIYKCNNEKSSLQQFLRNETIKELQSEVLMNPFKIQPILNDNATKALIYPTETDVNTIHVDNKSKQTIVDRPKDLKIERLDNMTEAQSNKIIIIENELEVTPNNNQPTLPFIRQENNQNDFVIATNNLSKENNESITTLKLIQYCKTLDQINIRENLEYVDKVNSINETTPISHLQMYEDVSPLDVNSLSSNIKLSSTVSSGFSEHMFAITTPSTSNTDVDTPDSTASLTIADVKLIDNTSLQVYLEQSIIIPLQIQNRIVNDALIKYLLNEHNMLIHLQSLRSYFFLLNGEFAKCLTNSLYARLYEISVPVELFNSATLTNLLERALISSFSSNYMNSELLSLSAIDTPVQLHISDPNALDCLCLSYKISWPLNIILDDVVMLQYSKVFKFLLMIGRVLWVLQEDFRMMKAEHKATISEQYHKLQLYRHSMTQFICALHNYITCSVLHTSWIEFEKDLCNSLTIDQVRLSHVNYIKRILSRCMLNTRGEKVRTCLGNIFKVILKFHNRLRSQNWIPTSQGYIHPNFKRLEQMYEAFCELRTYLSRIALKLTTSGYQPHLIHFLNTLNINHTYDLSEKSS